MSWVQFITAGVGVLSILAVIIKVGMVLGRVETTLSEIADELMEIGSDFKSLSERVRALEIGTRPTRLRR